MFKYPSRKAFLRTYGIILGGSVLDFLFRPSVFTFQQHVVIHLILVCMTIVIWESLRLVNNYLNLRFPYDKNLTLRIALQLGIGIGIGITTRIIVYSFGEPHLPFKLDELFLATTWFIYAIIPCVINLIYFTSYFVRQWKDSLIQNEKLEKEKAQVQFDNLKNQLNPHFLFNALTSLNSLISENQQLASEFLQQLSKVYRYLLQNKEKATVDLNTEIEFIKHYTSLLETRFGHALQIITNIDDSAKDRSIVPVTLQILIENAIKHNIVDPDKPLRLEITTSDDYLIVSNNLQLRRQVETSNKMGLENLKSLYSFLTTQPVIIEETDTKFFVKIPLI